MFYNARQTIRKIWTRPDVGIGCNHLRHNPPTSLSVVVGKSGIAHRREDGVYVLPITSLRP